MEPWIPENDTTFLFGSDSLMTAHHALDLTANNPAMRGGRTARAQSSCPHRSRTQLVGASVGIDLDARPGGNADNLRAIAQVLRVVRALGPDAPLTIRDDEIDNVARVLDLRDGGLPVLLEQYLSLDASRARELHARLVDSATS